jgi:hypothetical protein
VTIAIYTTVLPVCRFSSSSASGDTAAITYRCTNGIAPAFAVTASVFECASCPDDSSRALIVSDDGGVGRGLGAGRELTLVVTAPIATPPVQTAFASIASGAISITVSP